MKARRVKKLDPDRSLTENAARIVRVRIAELRSFASKALEPGSTREQHDMRIAAKRLRYVLEATGFCFGRSADLARRRARDLQEILGELHDCDVMLPRVERHLSELREADVAVVRARAGDSDDLDPALAARAPHRSSYRGLEVLIVFLEARRELLFHRFQQFWSEQERLGTWDRLELKANRLLAEARATRRAGKHAIKERGEAGGAPRVRRPATREVLRGSRAAGAPDGGGVGQAPRR